MLAARSQQHRLIYFLAAAVFGVLCSVSALADELAESTGADRKAEQGQHQAVHTNQAEPGGLSPVVTAGQELLASSPAARSDAEVLQDQAGMCSVVEGIMADFCAQNPQDSGCLAVQQLNSQ